MAHVFFELVFGEHKLFLRPSRIRRHVFAVISVNRQCPVDLDRLGLVAAVEIDPAAEPTHTRLLRLVQHGVGPDDHHPVGNPGLVVRLEPGNRPDLFSRRELASARRYDRRHSDRC